MVIRKLLCPHCGAPLSPPAAATTITCQYCGNSFPISAGRSAPPIHPRLIPVLTGLVVAVVAISLALVLVVVKVGKGSTTELSSHAPNKNPSTSLGVSYVPSATPPPEVELPAVPAVPAAPEVPIRASFTFDHKWTSSIGSLWFYGRVKNESSIAIGKPRIRAVLKDQAKADIATFTGYPHREELLPGEVAPVTILVVKPPSYKDVVFEVSAQPPFGALPVLRKLRVEPLEPRESSTMGYWEFEGKVTNDENVAVQFAQVEVTLLGTDGTVVGLGHAYTDERVLQPGISSRFQSRVSVVAPHAKVTYVSWGRPK